MQVIAAVFASSTYALVGVMASWTTVFLMVGHRKNVNHPVSEIRFHEVSSCLPEIYSSS